MYISTVILLGVAIIAGTILFATRWEIVLVSGQVTRVDRWTGAVVACRADAGVAKYTISGDPIPLTCAAP